MRKPRELERFLEVCYGKLSCLPYQKLSFGPSDQVGISSKSEFIEDSQHFPVGQPQHRPLGSCHHAKPIAKNPIPIERQLMHELVHNLAKSDLFGSFVYLPVIHLSIGLFEDSMTLCTYKNPLCQAIGLGRPRWGLRWKCCSSIHLQSQRTQADSSHPIRLHHPSPRSYQWLQGKCQLKKEEEGLLSVELG